MRIIGLAGVARSGKDTVAGIIDGLLEGVKVEGFAWKLKLSAYRCFNPNGTLEEALEWSDWLKTEGCLMQFPEDTGYGEGGDTIDGRAFLQNYGTEAHRDVFGKDFWVEALLPKGRDDCSVLVIPDTRFENETRHVVDRGGEIWLVTRPGVEAVNNHSSEVLPPADLISHNIMNDGTLRDLEAKVMGALSEPR